MNDLLKLTSAAVVLLSFTLVGCTRAKPSRMSALRAKAVAVAPAPMQAEPVAEAPAPSTVIAVTETGPVVPAAPVKRMKNPSVPPWQQLAPDMTKEEVEEFVGKPNAKSEVKWVYKSGASVRFTDKGLLASYDAPRK